MVFLTFDICAIIAEMRWVHSYGPRLAAVGRLRLVNYGQRLPVFNTLSKMHHLSFHVHHDDDDFIRMPFRRVRVCEWRRGAVPEIRALVNRLKVISFVTWSLNVRGHASVFAQVEKSICAVEINSTKIFVSLHFECVCVCVLSTFAHLKSRKPKNGKNWINVPRTRIGFRDAALLINCKLDANRRRCGATHTAWNEQQQRESTKWYTHFVYGDLKRHRVSRFAIFHVNGAKNEYPTVWDCMEIIIIMMMIGWMIASRSYQMCLSI